MRRSTQLECIRACCRKASGAGARAWAMGFGRNCCRHDDRDGNFFEAGADGARGTKRRGCICGALSYAELGAAIPEAGGEYAYLRHGFGPMWGFLFGWMHSIVGRPASAASIAAGGVRFLAFLIPSISTPIFALHIAIPGLTHWYKPYDFTFTWAQPLAVVWLIVMTGVNYIGVKFGGAV